MKTAPDFVSSDAPTRPATIAVVEDEVFVRIMIAEYLRDRGLRVIEAGSAEEAIRMLRANEHVDLVFSDVQMPGSLDGFGLAQWIRREQPDVKIILVSGMARSVTAAGERGEEDTPMGKPYEPEEVEQRIWKLLAQ
jgi:CheY-like chemotaxis protein